MPSVSSRVPAGDPDAIHAYDGTAIEGKLDKCRQCCGTEDFADLHAPYALEGAGQATQCQYECHRGHRWQRGFFDSSGTTARPAFKTDEVVQRLGNLGGLYFIHGAGHIKIGTSGNIRQRFESLRTGSPVELTLLAVASGGHTEEQELHRQFAMYRVRGEWFLAAPKILAYIAQHTVRLPENLTRPTDPQHFTDACHQCGSAGAPYGSHPAVELDWHHGGVDALHQCPAGHQWTCSWGDQFLAYEDCACSWCRITTGRLAIT